jgi:DNA-binding NarL/FixJ family response regulator
MSLRALIADDHVMFRDGLETMLLNVMGFEHVDQAGSLSEAMALLDAKIAPDLLIVDLQMPGVTGIESFAALRERFPAMKLVVMSGFEERAPILASLAGRLNGYIPKSLPVSELETALREILSGRIYVPSTLSHSAPEKTYDESAVPTVVLSELTSRQQDVLNELLKGRSSKQIARELHIAEGTVKIHLATIYRVVGVTTRAETIAKLAPRMKAQ